MKKIWAVFKREYLQVVRKKSFLILTVLGPFLLGGMMLIPAALAVKGLGGKRVAVVDGTTRLGEMFRKVGETREPAKARGPIGRAAPRGALNLQFDYVKAQGNPDLAAQAYLKRLAGDKVGKEERLDGVLVIPEDAFENSNARLVYYSRTASDLMTAERLERLVNRAVSRERLVSRGIDPSETEALLKPLEVEGVQLSKTGERKTGGKLGFLAAFLFVALLLVPMLIYGQEIMRGIVAEKTERIVEILISSMSPMQLLTGKILGLAALGLTQMAVWFGMGAAAVFYAGSVAATANPGALQFLNARVIAFFLLFYLLGYLVYVCVYAVAGAVSNSEKEAQQFVTPLIFFIMVPWILAMPIIQNPESRMAVGLSLVPVFTPITMFMRVVVSEPPLWQIALSVALSLGTIYAMFWITAKIFRVGILSYGKRPTIPELWRWLKVA